MPTYTAPTKKAKAPVFPSRYGSHKSMVYEAETAKFRTNPANEGLLTDLDGNPIPLGQLVVLQDGEGFYVTELKELDTGLADLNRYDSTRDSRKPWPKVEKSNTQKKKDNKKNKKAKKAKK